MRLLIVGATGGTGRALVEQALARGHDVTALARNPARLRVTHPRLTVVAGDVMVPVSLDHAVRGQDAVLSALGHKRWFYPTRILSAGTQHLIDAMRRHGVRRLVVETALGVGETWWQMGLYYTLFVRVFILPFYFFDKRRQEALVCGSGLDWTLVRPGALNDGPRRGVFRQGPRVGHWLWTVGISRADVAGFMLDQVSDPRYVNAVVGIAD
jgi:putative NADH-flavin reductase